MKNIEVIQLSNGGISLDNLNDITPYERNQYWELLHELEQDRISKVSEAYKKEMDSSLIVALYGK